MVQPREILEFYRDLTEKADFELKTAGILKGGKKLWALARTGQLGISISAWDEYIYQLNLLSNRKVKNAEVDRYLWQVFNDKAASISSSFNERVINKCKSLFEGHGRGAMLDSAKGTTFGLLNSVTEFVDPECRAKSTDHRLESAWFGNGAMIKQRAWIWQG